MISVFFSFVLLDLRIESNKSLNLNYLPIYYFKFLEIHPMKYNKPCAFYILRTILSSLWSASWLRGSTVCYHGRAYVIVVPGNILSYTSQQCNVASTMFSHPSLWHPFTANGYFHDLVICQLFLQLIDLSIFAVSSSSNGEEVILMSEWLQVSEIKTICLYASEIHVYN